jgi:hypothetical protein
MFNIFAGTTQCDGSMPVQNEPHDGLEFPKAMAYSGTLTQKKPLALQRHMPTTQNCYLAFKDRS